MSLKEMIVDATRLSNKYNVIIELDFKYTESNFFDINIFKCFKFKEPELIDPNNSNNEKISKFFNKYVWSEFLEVGEYYKITPQ